VTGSPTAKFRTIPGQRSVTVRAPIGAARVTKRFPDTTEADIVPARIAAEAYPAVMRVSRGVS
jgi:hypothetical protein